MTLMQRRRALMGASGEPLIYDEVNGRFYPKHLDITMNNRTSENIFSNAYRYAQYLESATVRGFSYCGMNGSASDSFSNCPRLTTLSILDGVGKNSYIAQSCPLLSDITLGSVGHAVAEIYSNAFRYSGASAESKTITVYVSDSATLPLANAPWGLTGATVIYRSATTGEVIEV